MEQSSILRFFKKPASTQPASSRPENTRPGQPYHRKNTNRPKHYPSNQNRPPNRRRNMNLKLTADETKKVLPDVLSGLPPYFDAHWSCLETLFHKDGADLPPNRCPALKKPCIIQVLNMDSFDAAIQLDPTNTVRKHISKKKPDIDGENGRRNVDTPMDDIATPEDAQDKPQEPEDKQQPLDSATSEGIRYQLQDPEGKEHSEDATDPERVSPVAVLNLASERSPGGGWQNGALAQEECLCYRSSLYLSLDSSFYPIPPLSAIYSPNVVLIRTSMADGHKLLDSTPPIDLPALSVISVAAIRRPDLSDDGKTFKYPGARAHTKNNIRLVLRVAARHGHMKLVLGALGCGVFANPPRDVAHCFLEVLREPEFQGGWWENIVFAVLDNVQGPDGGKDGNGNFGQFYQVLHGQVV